MTNRSQCAELEKTRKLFFIEIEHQNMGCRKAPYLDLVFFTYISPFDSLSRHLGVNQASIVNTLMILNSSSLSLSLQSLPTYTHLNLLLLFFLNGFSLQWLALNPEKCDANSVLSVTHFVMNKLQLIQNTLGRVVLELDNLAQPELLPTTSLAAGPQQKMIQDWLDDLPSPYKVSPVFCFTDSLLPTCPFHLFH
jgi:hypothetical protein